MAECLIGLGSNLGDRRAILDSAVAALRQHVSLSAVSSWYNYRAVGGPDGQGDFLNGAVVADTELPAPQLVALLHDLEQTSGRKRVQRWSSRTLDCDLLLYGMERINAPSLQVPHPRMITRRFVLEPADEVAGHMIHPHNLWSIKQLFRHLKEAEPYYCVIGLDRELVHTVATQVGKQLDCGVISHDAPLSGSGRSVALEWSNRADELLRNADSSKPLVSTFWIWEPWLRNIEPIPSGLKPERNPKLVIVTEPLDSEFGQRFDKLDTQLRVPTLFLSAGRKDALQDAIGAVLAMN